MAKVATHHVSTMEWDTVFAVTLEEINDHIAANPKACPPDMTSSPGDDDSVLTAKFGTWRLVPGGDSATVNVFIPMKDLKVTYVLNGKPGAATCDEADVVITIRLDLSVHEGELTYRDGTKIPPPPTGAKRHTLKVRTKTDDARKPVASIFRSPKYRTALSEPDTDFLIEPAILRWCNENLATFAHVFAVIDIFDTHPGGDWAFARPVTSQYAYVDKPSEDSGYLAILSMTSDRPTPFTALDPHVIPEGCDSAFLLGSGLFLRDIVAPALLAQWPKLKSTDLEFSGDQTIMRLKDGLKVDLPEQTTEDGDAYTPILRGLTFEIQEAELKVELYTEVEVKPGVYATGHDTQWFGLTVGENKKGKAALIFKKTRALAPDPGHRVDHGVETTSEVLKWIAIGAGILLLFCEGPLGWVLLGVAFGCAIGHFVMEHNMEDGYDDAPPLDELVKQITTPVKWSQKKINLTGGGLHGSLQFGGHWR